MPVKSTSFTHTWFGRDMKEYISFVKGEFFLTRMGVKEPEKLGITLAEVTESLAKTGRIDNFPDFQ